MSEVCWALYPEAEIYLTSKVSEFLGKNAFARTLAAKMKKMASLRLFDLIDHMIIPKKPDIEEKLFSLGFEIGDDYTIDNPDLTTLFVHPKSILFPLLLTEEEVSEIVLKVEHLDHFVQMLGMHVPIMGETYGPYRKAIVNTEAETIVSAVERRGYSGFTNYPTQQSRDTQTYRQALEAFYTRQRYFEQDKEGLQYTFELVTDIISELDVPRACDAFFRAERRYWESKDRVGSLQRSRQDMFGVGWGNHDHHTYRSSRSNFSTLIAILELLGFQKREQFFAGEKAGWGAQVLEQPDCDIVIFADVDITDDERGKDFTGSIMNEMDRLGTVGLWVALHGESMLEAGLHHLAARVDFEDVRTNLPQYCVDTLPPFSDFEFLKQAFSKTERRSIDEKRLASLFEARVISEEGMNTFSEKGAIGSHLEIIQRNQGFKGFNQDAVTAIIKDTDPRKH